MNDTGFIRLVDAGLLPWGFIYRFRHLRGIEDDPQALVSPEASALLIKREGECVSDFVGCPKRCACGTFRMER